MKAGRLRSGPRLALAIVAVASRLVSRAKRRRWRLEWEGEIHARWNALEETGDATFRARMDLAARAMGSTVDAVVYDKGRWRVDGMFQDLTVVVRTLLRKPGLSLVVILTLAIGIGANTAMFSVAREVLIRPFPYPDPERVVAVEGISTNGARLSGNVTYPNIHDLGAATEGFSGIGAARRWDPALEDAGGSIIVRGAVVTSNFFRILGIDPGLGRFFRPEEQGSDRHHVVVLTHAFWMDRFGGDPAIVGRNLRLNDVVYEVVGVTSADFEDPWIIDGPGGQPQLFRTVESPPSEWPRSGRSWKGLARVRPGVSLAAAQDEIDAAFAGLVRTYPEQNADRAMRLIPLRDRIAGPARPVMVTLLVAVGMLLLIACANLANLLLGRALERQSEFSIHKALGAPGWRLFNRGLAEAAVLAATGGALGLLLALLLVNLAQRLGPILPRPISGEVDPGVLAFAFTVTVGAGLLFGSVPALHAARTGIVGGDWPGNGRSTTDRSGRRLRRALVVGEVTLTTALLIGSGLLVRSFQRLGQVDLGLETEGVVSFQLHGSAWWALEPDEAMAQWQAVMDAVRTVPGVLAAGAIDYVPFAGSFSCDRVERTDLPRPGPGEAMCAETRMVLPGVLETLGVPLVRGRSLERTDLSDRPYVALVDQHLAEALWPGEDPIGRQIRVHGNEHAVVGIVGNMRHFGPADAARPQLYLHAPQDGWNGIRRGLNVIASTRDPAALIGPIRSAITGVNASIAVGSVETIDGLLAKSLAAQRFRTTLMAAFGLTALLLAVIGIVGIMNYSVAQRTREMGVRLALGAEPLRVRGLVLREGARLGALGIALGVAGALTFAGLIDQRLLFEIGARDPWVYSAVVVLLALATAGACWVPARRASNVDPMSALTEL